MDNQFEPHPERLTAEYSQQLRNDAGIQHHTIDDVTRGQISQLVEESLRSGRLRRASREVHAPRSGFLRDHDTQAELHLSSQEQHQQKQYCQGAEVDNGEEDRCDQEMILVHSVSLPTPIDVHATPPVVTAIEQPIRAHDSSSSRSLSPPRSREENVIRSGISSMSDSESRGLRQLRGHSARAGCGAAAAARVQEGWAELCTSQEAEVAANPDEVKVPGDHPQDDQARATPQDGNWRLSRSDSLESVETDYAVKRHSFVSSETEDPFYLSSDDDGSGVSSVDMEEVMGLRPSADANVHRMDTCSLVSFGTNMSVDRGLVLLGLQASGEKRSMGQDTEDDLFRINLDVDLGSADNDFVGNGSGLGGSIGTGGGGNTTGANVDPLGDTELAYQALLALLREDSCPIPDANEDDKNRIFHRRPSNGRWSHDSVMSGYGSAMARDRDEIDSHRESSGSVTSSQSIEAGRRPHHSYVRMCARVMAGVMILAALSGSVLYIVVEEKSFTDHSPFAGLFGNSSKEQQEQIHDEISQKNSQHLLRHRTRRENRKEQQRRIRARKEQLQRDGTANPGVARRRAMLREGHGGLYYGQDDNPIHQVNNPFVHQDTPFNYRGETPWQHNGHREEARRKLLESEWVDASSEAVAAIKEGPLSSVVTSGSLAVGAAGGGRSSRQQSPERRISRQELRKYHSGNVNVIKVRMVLE